MLFYAATYKLNDNLNAIVEYEARTKMRHNNIVQKLYKRFVISSIKDSESVPNVDQWTIFLNSFPEPKDCIERSWFKYLCRSQFIPTRKAFLLNAVSIPVLATCIPILFTSKSSSKKKDDLLLIQLSDEVPLDDVIPQKLLENYENRLVIPNDKPLYGRLTPKARALFLQTLKRYPLHPFFLLFVWKELLKHSAYIRKYNPSATAVYVNERNVASPILRELYESDGRKLISFMHGEYLLNLIQAFMDFSEYWVWDDHYVRMFSDYLHCRKEQFRVYTPRKLQKKWHLEDVEPTNYCTYYFSGESEESISLVAKAFSELSRNGLHCMVRPHPRYSHLEAIDRAFPASMIEDPHEISLQDSLANTRYAVGLSTTVLFEARIEGRGIVIDDITDPKAYLNLRARQFRLLDCNHRLFSELMAANDGMTNG